MAKAKKVETATQAQVDPMAQMMNMMQTMATSFESFNRRLSMIEQNANSTDPGNPMFSQPSNRLEKRTVAEQPMGRCQIEATTDPRGAFIAILGRKHLGPLYGGDGKTNSRGVVMSYLTTKIAGYKETVHGWAKLQGVNVPIKTVSFDGHLPVGTIIQTHDGYGYDFYAQTEKGVVSIDEDRAIQAVLS